MDWGADLVVLVTDGWENDPPSGASEILRVYRDRLDPKQKTSIIHCNPVYNADDFSLHPLSHTIPTVGLRDAEDLPTMLGFARFAGRLPAWKISWTRHLNHLEPRSSPKSSAGKIAILSRVPCGMDKTDRKVTDQFKQMMEIVFDDYLPQWNYTAVPQTP